MAIRKSHYISSKCQTPTMSQKWAPRPLSGMAWHPISSTNAIQRVWGQFPPQYVNRTNWAQNGRHPPTSQKWFKWALRPLWHDQAPNIFHKCNTLGLGGISMAIRKSHYTSSKRQTPTMSQKWSKWALRPLSGMARLPISSTNAIQWVWEPFPQQYVNRTTLAQNSRHPSCLRNGLSGL